MDNETRRMNEPQLPDNPMQNAAGTGDADADARSVEIRTEIEITREEMAQTIDAIEEKLRPSNIVHEAKERVKSAATERMRAMADTAGEAASSVAERTRRSAGGFMDSIRENPYPALLIGGGLAWWISSMRKQPSYDSRYGRNDRYGSRYYDDQRDLYGLEREPYGSSREQSFRDQIGARAREYTEDTREYVGEKTRELQQAGRKAQNQLQRMLNDNPMLVGAGALLLGAAFGMAVPETDTENEWLGEARDNVVERAQQLASDAAEKVEQTASDVASAAGNIADSVKNP